MLLQAAGIPSNKEENPIFEIQHERKIYNSLKEDHK